MHDGLIILLLVLSLIFLSLPSLSFFFLFFFRVFIAERIQLQTFFNFGDEGGEGDVGGYIGG